MITDKLININKYKGISKSIDITIDFISNNNLDKFEFGKHEINKNIYFVKSTYETKDESELLFEAHIKKIDLQVILSGEEIITGNEIKDLKKEIDYDKKKDALFLSGKSMWSITCTKKTFVIFNIEDAHKPGIKTNLKSNIIKIVFKIDDK